MATNFKFSLLASASVFILFFLVRSNWVYEFRPPLFRVLHFDVFFTKSFLTPGYPKTFDSATSVVLPRRPIYRSNKSQDGCHDDPVVQKEEHAKRYPFTKPINNRPLVLRHCYSPRQSVLLRDLSFLSFFSSIIFRLVKKSSLAVLTSFQPLLLFLRARLCIRLGYVVESWFFPDHSPKFSLIWSSDGSGFQLSQYPFLMVWFLGHLTEYLFVSFSPFSSCRIQWQ